MKRSPIERWGTCCPFDPECHHSFMDDIELDRWMERPLSDAEAETVADGLTPTVEGTR